MLSTELAGACTHNLKSVDLSLVPGQIVVLTGVSGAGKSSLALDTLYAEGQRRFVESFSPYVRQFLERLERPPIDRLEPVPAGIAVDRSAPVKSSRSTVATLADLEPYLSALFTRAAQPVCPEHQQTAADLGLTELISECVHFYAEINQAASAPKREGLSALICYPAFALDLEGYLELRARLTEQGYQRVWLPSAEGELNSGRIYHLDELKPSQALGRTLGVILDRLPLKPEAEGRIGQALERAFGEPNPEVWVLVGEFGRRAALAGANSNKEISCAGLKLRLGLNCLACARRGVVQELRRSTPGLFSYESPLGACGACRGFGRVIGLDLDKVIPNPQLSLGEGAIKPWAKGKSTTWERRELKKFCKLHQIPMDLPWNKLDNSQRNLVLNGEPGGGGAKSPKHEFFGVQGWFRWLEARTYKMHVRVFLARYRAYEVCPECQGRRLNQLALSYRLAGLNLAEWHALEIHSVRKKIDALNVSGQAELARAELSSRLSYLERVGLGYLTLDRQARSLSGGETQRVTLTAALGTSLHNALFVLDEPTVGLHPRDIAPLAQLLRELADRGNVVLVVEHDPLLIAAADRVIELGPGAGELGGRICSDSNPPPKKSTGGAAVRSLLPKGNFLKPVLMAAEPRASYRRSPSGWLTLKGVSENNLRGINVEVPLGVICAVTGPSGSGKSSLVGKVLAPALARKLGDFSVEKPGEHLALEGAEQLKRVSLVDQSPLGRTSRGNAATYSKAWDKIRAIYAREPLAQLNGVTAGAFSFNVDGGRCEACKGEGYETVEMQFLADVRLSCPVCGGRRFQPQVLAVEHAGVNIAELLDTTVDDALTLFNSYKEIQRCLGPVARLGLGYLKLGQPLSTLSGGEAQRLKLARALAEPLDGALLVLDEPSAGLHSSEIELLHRALRDVLKAGGHIVLVDHDLELIRLADWVIDLGPGGGASGGSIVSVGTPEQLAQGEGATGEALRAGPAPKLKVRPVVLSEPALMVERAREHNLQDVSVKIPHGKLAVITGPSGSGKSSLAFDVIFAEGQRRFLETLTPYARQFLPTLPRPDVSRVSGVPPAIALEQRTSRAGAKSTVATVTEVAHYLRLLYSKLGVPYCPEHQVPIQSTRPSQLWQSLRKRKGAFALLAPVVQARKGTYLDVFNQAKRSNIEKAYADGVLVSTDAPPTLKRSQEHDIDLVIGELVKAAELDEGLLQRALSWGRGAVKVMERGPRERVLELGGSLEPSCVSFFSTHAACPSCGISVAELDPRFFSFNTKQGRCEACEGDGYVLEAPKRKGRGRAKHKEPGEERWVVCSSCDGERLSAVPRAVRFTGLRYPELLAMPVARCLDYLEGLQLKGDDERVGRAILQELTRRLSFLEEVGLGYLTLERSAKSLSGGELQRLRLAAQLGSGLTGALYVLDEPTIGLHPRDTQRLIKNLRRLVGQGSTVLVVEHDEEMIRAADYLVDVGPGGGVSGGQILAAGEPEEVLGHSGSLTAKSLREPLELRSTRPVSLRAAKADLDSEWIHLSGATAHNLRQVSLEIPKGRLTVVAGVSGSGKSTLVRQVLLPALRRELGLVSEEPLAFSALSGTSGLVRALSVDQSPIGRTPRSVPATFLGIFDDLRKFYASLPEAKVRGYGANRFSFNAAAGGRCELCAGQGAITHEMSFLPDVTTRCPSCEGLRFEPATLEVKYKGMSIGDVLNLSVSQALEQLAAHPRIIRPLRTLVELGAGYIRLGQGSHTLSGGEAQRLKLASELTQGKNHAQTLYVLDEPTTGLHLSDVGKLLSVLDQLVARGDTLVVIEHHPQVIASADWVVELGPEGGEAGGRIVAAGTPRQVAKKKTATGKVLAALGDQLGARR